jgi:alpha-galactosidase
MMDLPDATADTYLMFDLGNDEACEWLCRYIGDMIEENGIDYYRQDFNMFPDQYWQAHDEPGRSGISEIRHIENLYKFWDYLTARFPNLLIDNCASGGKRIDMETIPRSAPLWRSDYYHYDDPDGYQSHTYGLNFFLPIHGTGSLQTDPYSFRSSMGTCLIYNWKITDKRWSVTDMRARLAEFHDIRPYYYEDYYPLTGTNDTTLADIWLAWQFHRPADDSGIVVAFRRAGSVEPGIRVSLSGVDRAKTYRLTDQDTGKAVTVAGAELAGGYSLAIDRAPGSLLLKYEVVK